MTRVVPLPIARVGHRRLASPRADDTGSAPVHAGITPHPVWVPPGPSPLELAGGTVAGIATAVAAPVLAPRVFAALGSLVARRSDPPAPEPPTGPVGVVGQPGRPARRPSWDDGPEDDPGWFGPTSVAWKVHADTSMFVAGMTAFALQALHPLALAGVADHSSFADDFLGRTRRTGEFVAGVIYGSSAEAAHRVAGVHRIHERVVGTAPDGRSYSANDPDLLEWVHITEYLSIAAAFRRFALRPLSLEELDHYVAEVAVVGEAMGVPSPPRSWAELDAAFQRFRPQMAVGEQATVALQFLRRPPGLPAAAMPAWRTVWSGAVACMPPSTRSLLGLQTPSTAELTGCRALVRSLGSLLGPPPALAAGRARVGLAAS